VHQSFGAIVTRTRTESADSAQSRLTTASAAASGRIGKASPKPLIFSARPEAGLLYSIYASGTDQTSGERHSPNAKKDELSAGRLS
jgi:hypothetical protein